MALSLRAIGFLVLASASVALFVLVLRILRQGRAVKVGDAGLLIPVLLGLVYDNAMLGLGSLAGESAAMEALSVPRYLMHALFTPLLIIFAALSADRLNVPGYRSRERLTLWGAVAFVAIWVGLIADLIKLHLEPRDADGIFSYAHTAAGPPIAEIITVVSLLIIGGTVQRYARWPWIFLGAAQMFVIAAFFVSNGLLANIGEIVLLSSMVVTGAEAVRRVGLERDSRKRAALDRHARSRGSTVAAPEAATTA
jgi:hypothetical protein